VELGMVASELRPGKLRSRAEDGLLIRALQQCETGVQTDVGFAGV